MTKSIHITSLGCPKNFVDSEVIIGLLEKDGWQLEEHPERASVLLINTCGFIQPAVEEGIEEILGLAAYKAQAPATKLVVTGCMVQRYREKLLIEIPEIDLMIGTEGVQDIHIQLDKLIKKEGDEKIYIPDRFLMNASMPRRLATPFYRAWMKITEGCNNRCSYCMIPSIRGELRSREIDDLTAEAMILEDGGVKELTMIAQDLTAYGTEHRTNSMLIPLLEDVLAKTSLPWLRLLYLYPSGVTDGLLQLMAENSRIVPYLDIPFQHVSNSVLKKMNRRYTTDTLLDLIERSRKHLPDIALRTTFLVGFPGETEDDILQLEEFITDVKIDHVGVFAYANEEGCPSEYFPNQIDEHEKNNRVAHILSVQSSISEEMQRKYLGKTLPVLVEGVSRETDLLLEGRTRYQAPDIDGCVYINDGNASVGDIVDVEISDTQVYDLVGAIV